MYRLPLTYSSTRQPLSDPAAKDAAVSQREQDGRSAASVSGTSLTPRRTKDPSAGRARVDILVPAITDVEYYRDSRSRTESKLPEKAVESKASEKTSESSRTHRPAVSGTKRVDSMKKIKKTPLQKCLESFHRLDLADGTYEKDLLNSIDNLSSIKIFGTHDLARKMIVDGIGFLPADLRLLFLAKMTHHLAVTPELRDMASLDKTVELAKTYAPGISSEISKVLGEVRKEIALRCRRT